MPLARRVDPEILDSLPPGHPDAVASRRDLRLINVLMGNFRFIHRALARHDPGEGRIVELGAGDGELARHLMRKRPALVARYAAVDLAPHPPSWPAVAGWQQCDLFSDAGRAALGKSSVVLANLFLHHFGAERLAELGQRLGSARVLIFSEPARRRAHLAQGRLLAALAGHNRVTRHDLPVSVHAGFLRGELPEALGLDPAGWQWHETLTFLGACRLVAVRRG